MNNFKEINYYINPLKRCALRKLIKNDMQRCVGCNRCMRYCPVDEANIAYIENGEIKIRIDHDKCIACGACVSACQHNARDYEDDTERFIENLKRGVKISVLAAPSNLVQLEDPGRFFALLKSLGVHLIFDVSLGADICTWGHIRYIQKNSPGPIISQPCPAIVNYILMYQQELVEHLSPVHSPILCTAIYMKKYCGITDELAVLSPCIAKANEFEATNGYVKYNITFKKLMEYLESHNISLPQSTIGFDSPETGLGSLYSMPGGLKENVEFYLGKSIQIDKSEGQRVVYKALSAYAHAEKEILPAVFDVLNCQEGCNMGTGCVHREMFFETNKKMADERNHVLSDKEREYFDALYQDFDQTLRLQDFLRRYSSINMKSVKIDAEQIENAMISLDKETDIKKHFDCGACGSETCYQMAEKIVKGVNVPENCMQKNKNDITAQRETLLAIQQTNMENLRQILNDISLVKGFSDKIFNSVGGVNEAINKYDTMAKAIDQIAMNINIISLNASVEAARAGIHGKTFAVVAEEIRNLAKNSKQTVSDTENISKQAVTSIDSINMMIREIAGSVSRAYEDITRIFESPNGVSEAGTETPTEQMKQVEPTERAETHIGDERQKRRMMVPAKVR